MSELIHGRFVTGMAWSSIVAKGDLGKLAKQKAARDKANWYSHKDNQTNVGLATLSKKLVPEKGEHFLSAARLVAASNLFGPCFYALMLPNDSEYAGKVWICAVVDGVPVSSYDMIVSDIEAPQRLDAFLAQRGVSAGECGIYGDASGMPPGISPLSWDQAMLSPGRDDFAWLKSTTVSFIDELSPQKKAMGAAAVVLVVLYVGWGEYAKWSKKREAAKAAAQVVDPAVEWAKALAAWQDTKRAPGVEPLTTIRRAMATVPVSIEGWDLSGLDCSMSADGWTCVGAFSRTKNVARDPTTGAFLRARPQNWVVNPKSLDALEVNFQLPVARQPMVIGEAQTSAWHMENTTSTLQKAFRAFTSVSMSDFVPVALTPPVDPNGAGVEKPADFANPVVSNVMISGPMRSLDLAEIERLPAVWQSVRVTLAGTTEKPGLTTSAVLMEAKGEIYAKQ